MFLGIAILRKKNTSWILGEIVDCEVWSMEYGAWGMKCSVVVVLLGIVKPTSSILRECGVWQASHLELQRLQHFNGGEFGIRSRSRSRNCSTTYQYSVSAFRLRWLSSNFFSAVPKTFWLWLAWIPPTWWRHCHWCQAHLCPRIVGTSTSPAASALACSCLCPTSLRMGMRMPMRTLRMQTLRTRNPTIKNIQSEWQLRCACSVSATRTLRNHHLRTD